VTKMTLSVVWRGPKPIFVAPASGRIGRRSVDQQDRDAVLNGVDAVAYTALQTFPIVFLDHRLLANRAHENVEKILGNHSGSIVAPNALRNSGFICDKIAFLSIELGADCGADRGGMTARILDGSKMAAEIRAEVAAEVRVLAASGIRPGLAVVLAGNHPASQVYVRGKVKSSEEVGVYSEKHTPSESATTEELLALIANLNGREEIDGILVQLPLPPQVDAKKVLLAVDPAKDVDGFHPMNVGYLSTQRPGLVPCTPAGIMEILRRGGVQVAGQEAVVVGRSDIVGKPVAMLLLNQNATVTVCHSKTRDLPGVCRRADILVAAIGRAGMITRDFVKPGATVIDVGMNKVSDRKEFERIFAGNKKREETFLTKGSTLVGDVHPEVVEVAGAITPVPGGVGPLTVAMLMANTVKAAKLRRGEDVRLQR
jgi:methylenetetrahydrofolate dehydrogenase (NADP+)/methenyltetrahydrofolate cyclohydrolase